MSLFPKFHPERLRPAIPASPASRTGRNSGNSGNSSHATASKSEPSLNVYLYRLAGQEYDNVFLSPDDLTEATKSLRERFGDSFKSINRKGV